MGESPHEGEGGQHDGKPPPPPQQQQQQHLNTMKGNSLPTNPTHTNTTTEKPIRRTFSAVFRKRVRLFFRPWKWSRRKNDTKRAKSCSNPPAGPTRSISGIEGQHSQDNNLVSTTSYSTPDLTSPSQLEVKFELNLDEPSTTTTTTTATTTTNISTSYLPNGCTTTTATTTTATQIHTSAPIITTTSTTTFNTTTNSPKVHPDRTATTSVEDTATTTVDITQTVNTNDGVDRVSTQYDGGGVVVGGEERAVDVKDVAPSTHETTRPQQANPKEKEEDKKEEEEDGASEEQSTAGVHSKEISVVDRRVTSDIEVPPPVPPRIASVILPTASNNPCISPDDEEEDVAKSEATDSDEDHDSLSDDPNFEYYESTTDDEEEEQQNNIVTGLASRVKRTDSLALRLASRPSRGELENKNIISKTENEKVEQRTCTASSLVRRLSQRPSKEELEQRNILKSQTEQEAHEQFVETRKQLSRKLSRRPTVKELRKKKIIGFNEYVEVFDVQEYDRRADKPWTRLTPKDKASIRKELNEYKEYEMEVHEDSKMYTRFHRP